MSSQEKTKVIQNLRTSDEITLQQIRSTETGELGGWIQSKENLSQSGTAWVGEGVQVYAKAKVYGNAQVSGKVRVFHEAEIYGEAKVHGSGSDQILWSHIWIEGNAKVYGKAQILKTVKIQEHAEVFGNAIVTEKSLVVWKCKNFGIRFHYRISTYLWRRRGFWKCLD